MPIPVKCGACSATYYLPDDLSGRQVRCRVCQTVVRVPGMKYLPEFRVTTEESLKASPIVIASRPEVSPVVRVSKPKPVERDMDPAVVAEPVLDDEINFDDLDFAYRDDNPYSSYSSDDHVCKKCGEPIARRAKECEHCGAVFDAELKKKKSAEKKKIKKKNSRAPRPRTLIFIAAIVYLFAFIGLFGAVGGIIGAIKLADSQVSSAGVGLVMLYLSILLGGFATGLLYGVRYVWWMAVFGHTMSVISGAIGLLGILINGIPLMNSVPVIVSFGINCLMLSFYRSAPTEAFFQIEDAGLAKSLLMFLLLFFVQMALFGLVPLVLLIPFIKF